MKKIGKLYFFRIIFNEIRGIYHFDVFRSWFWSTCDPFLLCFSCCKLVIYRVAAFWFWAKNLSQISKTCSYTLLSQYVVYCITSDLAIFLCSFTDMCKLIKLTNWDIEIKLISTPVEKKLFRATTCHGYKLFQNENYLFTKPKRFFQYRKRPIGLP